MSTTIGRVLSVIGVVFAVIGLFMFEGISIEYPGIILGGLGYYFGLRSRDRIGQILGIAAVIVCVVSIFFPGLEAPRE